MKIIRISPLAFAVAVTASLACCDRRHITTDVIVCNGIGPDSVSIEWRPIVPERASVFSDSMIAAACREAWDR